MLKLYGHPRSRSTRASWALEEAGVPYEFVKVNLFQGEHRQDTYKALNPGAKVPTLVDGELILTESAAICTYIAEKFPKARLIPTDPEKRALYFKWCFFAIGELEQPLWTIAKHTFSLPEKRRVPAVIDTAKWEFGVALKVFSKGLDDRLYILGTEFSAADILLAHTLAWARLFDVPLEHANLEAYAERLLSRPAITKVVALEASSDS